MNCEPYELQIALYVEGDLGALESIQIEAHLATCAACHHFAEDLRASQAAFRTTSLDDFSDALLADLRHSVMNEIARRQSQPTFWQRLLLPWRWQYAAAGMIALLLLSTLFWQLKSHRQPDATNVIVAATPQIEPDVFEKKIFTSHDDAVAQRLPSPTKHSQQKRRSPLGPQTVIETASPNLIAAVALPGDSPMPAPVFFAEENADELFDSADISSSENANRDNKVNDNKVRLELQTRDPNIRIILFVDKEPRRVADTE